jgi:hypothetical protein
MSKTVQILLLAVLLPMVGNAREETLEERKQRITRKYLRERVNIAQSDMVVPGDLPEDERVLDSERFKEPEMDFQRQQPGAMPPPPRQRRPMPQKNDSNWLLDTIDEEESDPYADPFAASKSKDSKKEYGSMFGGRQEGSARSENRFGSPGYDPYASRRRFGSGYGSEADPRATQQGSSFDRTFQDGRYGQPGRDAQTDIHGRPKGTTASSGASLGAQRTFGSSPESGLLQTPFPRIDSSETDPTRRPGAKGTYSPYKSPYQTRREQQTQQGAGGQERQQEYKKPDAYQQWKDRSKAWDPTKDDAYLDDLMRQNRR